MKILEIKLETENGSTSLGFSQILVDYITKNQKWDYVFDCIMNDKKIDKSTWDY